MSQTDFERVLSKIGREDSVQLLKRILKIPGTLGQERPLAEMVVKELEQLGFESELMTFEEKRANAIGRLRGAGSGHSLMLQAHLDGPLLIEGWTVDPYGGEVKGDRIYGLAVRDVKAGIAACILAMKAIRDAGINLSGDVVFAGVAGHQDHAIGVEAMLAKGVRTDYCVISEPSDNRILIANRGWAYVDVVTHGKAAWTPKRAEGINAVTKMAKVILELDQVVFSPMTLPEEAKEFFPGPVAYTNIGLIEGGTRGNQVPDSCKITMDVRPVLGKELDIIDEIRARINKVREKDPQVDATVDYALGFPLESFFISPKHPMVKMMVSCFESVYKRKPAFYGGMGTTDAGKMQKVGIPTVVYGPGFQPYTVADEYLPIEDLITATKVYARSILEVCARDKTEFDRVFS